MKLQPLATAAILLLSLLTVGLGSDIVFPTEHKQALLIFVEEYSPDVEQIAVDLQAAGFEVHTIDTIRFANLAREYQIWETPTMVMLSNGVACRRESGLFTRDCLEGWFCEAVESCEPIASHEHHVGLNRLRENRPIGEYAAPVPDSLVSVHELTRTDGSMLSIVLELPVAEETLTRLDGPRHPYPHQGCLMCLGNHMISSHGQSTNYLHSITYDQWKILHDNLHNGKNFVGVRGSGEGYIGYEAGGSYGTRRGLFGRRRR